MARVALGLLVWAESLAGLRPSHHAAHLDILAVTVVPWVSTLTLVLGFYSRTSAAVTGGCLLLLHVWGGGIRHWGGGGIPFDTSTTWILGLSLVLLALTPCGHLLSVDRWRKPASEPADLWGLTLLRVHVSVIFAALVVGHLTPEFLSGERLTRLLVARHTTPIGAPVLMMGLSWLWLGVELACIAAPWVARRWLIPLGIGFALLQYPLLYTGIWSLLAAVLLGVCWAGDAPGPTATGSEGPGKDAS